MTEEEFEKLTITLLEHKFRYYNLDLPSISDYEYDMLERDFYRAGNKLGLFEGEDAPNWVGFDENHPLSNKIDPKLRTQYELNMKRLSGKN